MKVSDLIEKLKSMPQDREVAMVYDGAARERINIVYECNNGEVCLTDFGDVVYSNGCRPVGAPSNELEKYWRTPSDPNK